MCPEVPLRVLGFGTMTDSGYLQATKSSYDAVATDYGARFRNELNQQPVERMVLALYAELVRNAGGRVLDVGCGTGRVTAYLHSLGVDVSGVDLSPGMLEVAQKKYPDLRFSQGSMLSLDLEDGSVDGVMAWYSTIHVPDEGLPQVFRNFSQVLRPEGYVLLGFQVGNSTLSLAEAFGHPVKLDFHRRQPDWVAELLVEAGFDLHTQVIRESAKGEGVEPTQKAYLIARKP